jgi:hypothetical protein
MFDEEPDAKATRQAVQKIRQVEWTIGEVGVVWRPVWQVTTLAADE